MLLKLLYKSTWCKHSISRINPWTNVTNFQMRRTENQSGNVLFQDHEFSTYYWVLSPTLNDVILYITLLLRGHPLKTLRRGYQWFCDCSKTTFSTKKRDDERGSKILQNCVTWFMDDPLEHDWWLQKLKKGRRWSLEGSHLVKIKWNLSSNLIPLYQTLFSLILRLS